VDGGTDDLEQMRNLGPVSAARLRAVGIETPAQLKEVGAVEAYARLKRAFPIETTQIALYTLHGAITDAPWNVLSDEVKAALRDAAARRLPRQSGD
jgi:TfoX-like protein